MKKILLFPIVFGLLVFSCEKKENDPTPAPLTKTAATDELEKSSLTYSNAIASYTQATISTTSALNSLDNLANYNTLGSFDYSFFPSFEVAKGANYSTNIGARTKEQKMALALAALAKTQKIQAANGRLSSSKYEGGIYEYTIDVADNFGNGQNLYCYENKKYYKRYFKFTPTPNIKSIVFKFPSSKNYYENCDTLPPINNAIYTVTNIEEKTVNASYCNTTTSYVLISKIESKLEIDGVQKMSYNYNYDTDGSTFAKENVTMTVGDFKYEVEGYYSRGSSSHKTNWTGKSGKIYGSERNTEWTNSEPDCANIREENYDFYDIDIKKEINKFFFGTLTLQSTKEFNAYINAVKEKYKIANRKDITTDLLAETINKDTVLYNKYNRHEVFASNGAKVGDIIFRRENNLYYNWTPYLVYTDGTSEKLSNQFIFGLSVMYKYDYFSKYYDYQNNY